MYRDDINRVSALRATRCKLTSTRSGPLSTALNADRQSKALELARIRDFDCFARDERSGMRPPLDSGARRTSASDGGTAQKPDAGGRLKRVHFSVVEKQGGPSSAEQQWPSISLKRKEPSRLAHRAGRAFAEARRKLLDEALNGTGASCSDTDEDDDYDEASVVVLWTRDAHDRAGGDGLRSSSKISAKLLSPNPVQTGSNATGGSKPTRTAGTPKPRSSVMFATLATVNPLSCRQSCTTNSEKKRKASVAWLAREALSDAVNDGRRKKRAYKTTAKAARKAVAERAAAEQEHQRLREATEALEREEAHLVCTQDAIGRAWETSCQRESEAHMNAVHADEQLRRAEMVLREAEETLATAQEKTQSRPAGFRLSFFEEQDGPDLETAQKQAGLARDRERRARAQARGAEDSVDAAAVNRLAVWSMATTVHEQIQTTTTRQKSLEQPLRVVAEAVHAAGLEELRLKKDCVKPYRDYLASLNATERVRDTYRMFGTYEETPPRPKRIRGMKRGSGDVDASKVGEDIPEESAAKKPRRRHLGKFIVI